MKDFRPQYVIGAVLIVGAILIFGQYAFAVGDCDVECRAAHEDNYSQCLAECKERNQASVIDRINKTQVAWGDYCANGCADVDVWDYPACKSYCNSNNRASVEGSKKTKFASSIRIGDPKPSCGTDAWACFNGTDGDSPDIRDVGIFGVFASSHPCMHPSCD